MWLQRAKYVLNKNTQHDHEICSVAKIVTAMKRCANLLKGRMHYLLSPRKMMKQRKMKTINRVSLVGADAFLFFRSNAFQTFFVNRVIMASGTYASSNNSLAFLSLLQLKIISFNMMHASISTLQAFFVVQPTRSLEYTILSLARNTKKLVKLLFALPLDY